MPVQANCPGCEYAYDVAAPLWGKFVRCPQCRLEFRAPVPSGGAYADRPEPPPVPAVPVPQAESPGPVDRPRPRRRDSVEVPDRRSPAMKLLVSIAAVLLLAVLSVVGYMVLLADRSPRAGSGFGPTTRLLGGPAFVEMDEKAIAMAELVAEADARQEQLEAGRGEIAEGLARDAMRRRERLEIEPEPDRGPVPRELVAVPVPPQDPPAPIDLPRSRASERELARPAKGADANVIAIDVDVRTRTGGDRPILAWDTAGKTFYCLESAGTLRRIKLDGLKELRTLEIGFRSECLALSAEGLVVALPDREEVWVIASESLEVKHRIAVANVYRVVSSPDRSIAFAAGRASSLCVLDLKKGTVTFNYQEGGNEAHLYRGTCSPDGNYLFRMNNDVLERIRITGTNLSVEESGDHIARSSKAIQISPDSKWVALPDAAFGRDNVRFTLIYSVTRLRTPACEVDDGPRTAVGFDPKTGRIYAGGPWSRVEVLSPNGQNETQYDLGKASGETRAIAVHPAGNQLLVQTESKLFLVELDAEPKP